MSVTLVLPFFSLSTMYVFGGFNSLLLSDILVFTLEQCGAHRSEAACSAAGPGIRCVWDTGSSQCLSLELASEEQAEKLKSECFPKRSMFVFFLLGIQLILNLLLSWIMKGFSIFIPFMFTFLSKIFQ